MIGSARTADGEYRHPQAFQWLHPGLEDRLNGFVALQVNAAYRACAVIQVEIG